MVRWLGWVELLFTLAFGALNGCGGQATSRGQEASKCEPGTKCTVTDAGEPRPTCPPGTLPDGFSCYPIPGSGGAPSLGGGPGAGGSSSVGGSAGSGGATSTDASVGSGGVSTHPDGGIVGDAQGPFSDVGPNADRTPPNFAGCKLVSDVGYETLRVSWDPATDANTSSANIVYEVWVRPVGSTGDPQATAPTKTVVGELFVDVDGLIPGTDYEVLCSARDAVGNRNANQKLLTTTTTTDGTPPVFAGLATVEGVSGHSARLSWTAASDNASTSNEIVYAVYSADIARTEDLTTPTLLTSPGETSVIVGGLYGGREYFVVRARDRAGNEDANLFERSVTLILPTSFELDVQPIFTANCAILVCHTPGTDGLNPPIEGLNLDEGAAYINIVNVMPRNQGTLLNPPEPNLKRIDATSTNPMDSYLWRKIQQPKLSNIWGGTEPPPQSQKTLTPAQIQIITDWISEGSLRN